MRLNAERGDARGGNRRSNTATVFDAYSIESTVALTTVVRRQSCRTERFRLPRVPSLDSVFFADTRAGDDQIRSGHLIPLPNAHGFRVVSLYHSQIHTGAQMPSLWR